MHVGISRRLAAHQDSCICGHIWASQTEGSPVRVSVHAQQHARPGDARIPQIWLNSDKQEDTSGEIWTDGRMKSGLAQEMEPAEAADNIREER